MNKRSLAAMILIIALMITSPGLNNAAERSISGKEKLETLKGKEETLATASNLGTSSNAAEKNQKILSLVIPQKLEIIIDPLEVDERTQVYSEKYRIKNTGKTKGILQLSKLICKPGKSRHVEVRKNQEDVHIGKEKAIYLEMVLEYEELKENLNLQSEKHLVLSQEEASYEQTLEAGEEVILSFWGEVNEYASEPWEDKDVEITVLYSWKEVPEEPEEETEEEESPEVLKTAEEAEDDGLTELEKEETEPEESLEENVEESTEKNDMKNSENSEGSEKNSENMDENSEAIKEGLEETGDSSEKLKEEPKESLEGSEGSSEETKEELKETEESSSINPTERTEESAEIPSQAEEKMDGTDREHQETDVVETDKNTEEDKEDSSAVDTGNSNEKESSSSGKLESDADKEKDMDKDRGAEGRDQKESRPEAETEIKDRDESSTPDKIENKNNEEGDSSVKAERDEHVNDVHKAEDTENLDKDETGSP